MSLSPNLPRFVFHDPGQKRWSFLKWVSVALGAVALLGLSAFVWSLAAPPRLNLPADLLRSRQILSVVPAPLHPPAPNPVSATAPLSSPQSAASGRPIIFAFADPDDPASNQSLESTNSPITHLIFDAIELSWPNGDLHSRPEAFRPLPSSWSGKSLILVLSNNHDGSWRPEAVEDLSRAPRAAWDRLAENLLAELNRLHASGVLLDFRELGPESAVDVSHLIAHLSQFLAASGKTCWLSTSPGHPPCDANLLPSSVTWMARFDLLPSPDASPGPALRPETLPHWLDWMSSLRPAAQWLACFDAQSYDWTAGQEDAESLSFVDAMARARNAKVVAPEYDRGIPHFAYLEDGQTHEVWFPDAATLHNLARPALAAGVSGVGAYELGSADRRTWAALAAASLPPGEVDIRALEPLPGEEEIAHIGEGDFVTVLEERLDGRRTARFDNHGRLAFHYFNFPAYPTLFHEGEAATDEVALTFDDGPDPRWTPRILDILKARGVHAAFFVVGKNMEDHPDLVRRMIAEGHEVGLHTYSHPNLGLQPDARIELELNATQRLLEWVSGRSSILFRPPFNADTRPRNTTEIRPLAIAQDLGYITVLESIDPEDWQEPGAAAILERIKAIRAKGNIILLHDAGGDRSQTVQALPAILDWLQKREDRIVPLSVLLGQSRDTLMPWAIPSQDRLGQRISETGFFMLTHGKDVLGTLVAAAAVLLILRSLAVAIAAIRQSRLPEAPPGPFPPVSIILPAFNEAKVIRKTLDSLRATDYPGDWEIVVADDGSTDATAQLAEETAASDPRIRVCRLSNRGKSNAIEAAMAHASRDILVFIDADTLFETSTLRHLVAPFSDPRVGAVSGHARAGNTRTWLARFQDLEYTCGFNLDRRAYDLWNAITVVPGAVGAFRRQAVGEAGGIHHDTLAEDTDLTLALHSAGWVVRFAPKATAWTEVPETLRALYRQRFRWAYGTMQSAWKHRHLMFDPSRPGLGFIALPGIWWFQVFMAMASPVADIALLLGLLFGAPLGSLSYLAIFSLSDFIMAWLGCWIDRRPWTTALLILPMRMLYRPFLAMVVWRAVVTACRGVWVGWGKLERSDSVSLKECAR
ncbi:MAG: glycosyltransferase [Candidatus Methylacidiphilales bacterium]|nr:glycosyltransferase [Candidatus Methylacidiphilales bacterium]